MHDEHPFGNSSFVTFTPDTLQINQELLLQDEIFMEDYKNSIIDLENGREPTEKSYVSFVAVTRKTSHVLELSFCSDRSKRVHDLLIMLPCNQIVTCVSASRWDGRPRLFVKSEWLEQTLMRSNCIFGLIDAIGVTKGLEIGTPFFYYLPKLRAGLDAIAAKYPKIFFLSYSDAVLVKGQWSLGFFKTGVKYTYEPEQFICLFKEIQKLFREVLALSAYGIFIQGANEYYDDELIHMSRNNHVCLNSLGAPFADLYTIETAAKQSHKQNEKFSDLYLDELFFKSLKLKNEFRTSFPDWNSYLSKISKAEAWYASTSCDEILQNLESK